MPTRKLPISQVFGKGYIAFFLLKSLKMRFKMQVSFAVLPLKRFDYTQNFLHFCENYILNKNM